MFKYLDTSYTYDIFDPEPLYNLFMLPKMLNLTLC